MSKSITEKSCVVMINKTLYSAAMCLTPAEFINKARQGFEFDGDIFFYIPDFTQEQYNLLSRALDDVIWFAFSKEEIPQWVNPNIIVLMTKPVQETTQTQNAFIQPSFAQAPQISQPMPQMQQTPMQQMPQMTQQPMQSFQQPQIQSPFSQATQMSQPMSQMQQAPIQQMTQMTQQPMQSFQQPTSFEQPSSEFNSTYGNDDYENEQIQDIKRILESESIEVNDGTKEARINLFGSSKGGTGKTFTCLISAYRYAKTHPGEKVCLFDADITDPQVGTAVRKIKPNLSDYWKNWNNGNTSFSFMEICKNQNSKFPANLDFYLAPNDYVINNDQFWLDVLNNLISNYDVVFIDSGIDYINIPLISYCYKIADRIVLVSTTSVKSVTSVLKQINRLKGKIDSQDSNGRNVYSPSDEIGPKLRLAITGFIEADKKQNATILESFQKQIKLGALFGQFNSKIAQAEFFGRWNIFDNDKKFNESLDRLVDPNK